MQQFYMLSTVILLGVLLIIIGGFRWFPNWFQGFLFRRFSKTKENIAANPFLNGNYAPIHEEIAVSELQIIGEMPKDIEGIYMRNGSNPAFAPISYTYPFDGDGMLHAVYLQAGKASYRNRFVETKGFIAEKKAGFALYGGVMRPIPTDPKLIGPEGDPGPIKDGAFIHIIRHAQQYLAMYEGGPAYEVNAELKTIGEWCPPGGQRPFPINAHTRLDPRTGELFGFTYDLAPPYLRYYIFNQNGQLLVNTPIEKAYGSMIHDFVLTENYIIFFDCPAIMDLKQAKSGGSILTWKPELGVKVAVIHRKTKAIFWIETETFFVYHFVNGFEQEGQIFIDYVRHEKIAYGKALAADESSPMLYRAIITLSIKTIKHIQLDDHSVEFPRINETKNSADYRYLYLPTHQKTKSENVYHALMKYDLLEKKFIIHDFGKNKELGEAVFIPTPSPKNEDDGYLGLFVYDAADNKSEFILLHAQDFSGRPVARVLLPQRVPHGLHGSWMPGFKLALGIGSSLEIS